jgi:hypothetical protein
MRKPSLPAVPAFGPLLFTKLSLFDEAITHVVFKFNT